MARLKQGTLVVVADSEKALFLRNLTDHENPNLDFEGSEEQDNPSDREQSANRPGRMNNTGVNQRSALDDTDWHCFTLSQYDRESGEWTMDKAPVYHIVD